MSFAQILSSHPNKVVAHFSVPTAKCIPRKPYSSHSIPRNLPSRLKPKKAQQIFAFSTYVKDFLNANGQAGNDIAVVDVGAGQAYLTRELAEQLNCAYLLALDSDSDQTNGAATRREQFPSITHRTVDITPENLISVTISWLQDIGHHNLPVLFVGLHACGSLSVDILRAILDVLTNDNSTLNLIGGVVVPCCYNLLRPQDFPLASNHIYDSYPEVTELAKETTLPPSAYHLATQTPSAWDHRDSSWQLGVRKVVWRAILGRIVPQSFTSPPEDIEDKKRRAPFPRRKIYEEQTISHPPDDSDLDGLGHSSLHLTLGKLPKSAYTSWETFLRTVAGKLDVSFSDLVDRARHLDDELNLTHSTAPPPNPSIDANDAVDPVILELINSPSSPQCTSLLQTLVDPVSIPNEGHLSPPLHLARLLLSQHLTRCLLGPLVESWILMDGERWCQEQLMRVPNSALSSEATQEQSNPWQAWLVPLFDQHLGSGRNVSVVIGRRVPRVS